jgi:hypothetical protein
MSGYLRRLAASARNPGRAIHPIVGSFYAPPKPESAPLAIEELAVAADQRLQPPVVSIDPAQRWEAPVVNIEPARRPEPANPDKADLLLPSVRPSVNPLRADAEATTLETEPAITAVLPAARSHKPAARLEQLGERTDRPSRLPEQAAAQRVFPVDAYQPLVESHHRHADAPPGFAAPARNENAPHGKPRQVSMPAHQPDEIQIHIGRIEVTAVPPPSRPQTNSPRKSISLDEYLKRGTH